MLLLHLLCTSIVYIIKLLLHDMIKFLQDADLQYL